MKIIADAVLDAVVGEDDGEFVVEHARASIMTWLEGKDLRVGDRILIVRDLGSAKGDSGDGAQG